MELDRIVARDVEVGHVILAGGVVDGWSSIESVQHGPGASMTLSLRRVSDERATDWVIPADQCLTRGDATAVHSADEFIGLTVAQADVFAASLGWHCLDHSGGGFFTDDVRTGRINVWADQRGIVVRAELY